MLSVSRNETEILEFLLRHYSGSYTIRKIAEGLKMSPATAHKAVKDLERKGLLTTERIGPSLICRPNLESRKARHLAEAILADEDQSIPTDELKRFSAVLIAGDTAYLISPDSLALTENEQRAFQNFNIHTFTKEEFESKLAQRDKQVIEALSKSKVIHGEEFIVDALSRRGLH